MTNRLSKWSRHSSRMVCLLAACGLMYACKDEFLLDDEKPTWLNSSIYQSLQESGNFNTYLKLLADKDVNPENVRPLTDVLNRTGSKTVFVANDEAWEAFFKKNATLPESNPWHYATSYDKLSQAQKKLLIHTSMLNNAIVMENLASSEASGNSSPTRGEYMRRYTDIEATDSITFLKSEELPFNYSPIDKDYWARFREENGGKGIYLVTDSSVPMMLHFTSEHMTKNTVNDDDFEKFMGRQRVTSDVHIYDAQLIEKDGVCENGYVNVTEKPLCPLPSMAEVIRTSGMTNIFSHILDRYCAPFYCPQITRAYRTLHPDIFHEDDSIFSKRYFSDLSWGHRKLNSEPGPKGTYVTYAPYTSKPGIENSVDSLADRVPSLKFDPAWNGYYDEVAAEKDMAAIFVPSDKQLWNYFTPGGGGMQLINTYYINKGTAEEIPYVPPTTLDELYHQIDQIPLGTLEALINNLMMRSFVGSVPSKMTKLRNDAQEQLFYQEDISLIDTCLLASNGAVYVMDVVKGPARFTSVVSPAYITRTNRIMKWAIFDQTKLGLNYYAYLMAMQSKFFFFLPSDNGLKYYYDPTSMKSRTPRCIQMSYQNKTFPINSRNVNYYCPYNQDKGTMGELGGALNGTAAQNPESDVCNRLKDILESHTVVFDIASNNLMDSLQNNLKNEDLNKLVVDDEYFLSKNGNAVKVVRDEDGKIISVKGGFQLENERQGITSDNPGVEACLVEETARMENGNTYVLNAPLVPTYRSVYSILTDDLLETPEYNYHSKQGDGKTMDDNPYSNFYDLCSADGYTDLIRGCGLVDDNWSNSEKNAALKKYNIFVGDNGLDYNIQFFNNYHYSIFVPTNEAIEQAIENGLPTWEEIEEDYKAHRKRKLIENEEGTGWIEEPGTLNEETGEIEYEYSDSLATYEDSLRIQLKITYLTNFIRYHFADNTVFVDKSDLADNEMVTSSYDKELGLFCKIHVKREGGVLSICDDINHTNGTGWMPTVGEPNVLARDISCNKSPKGQAMSSITLDASSTAVIHQINGILNHSALVNGKHDSTWEHCFHGDPLAPQSVAKCKKYMKRYGTIVNTK